MKAGKNGIGSKGKGKEIKKKSKTPREIRTGRGSERKGEQRGKKRYKKWQRIRVQREDEVKTEEERKCRNCNKYGGRQDGNLQKQ